MDDQTAIKKDEYLKLLETNSVEQVYQEFLEQNSEFLPRQFLQNHGIHLSLFLRKLKLSSEYITDFFVMSKNTIDWNYVLIEIEKPSSKFFRDGTNDFHSDFRNAYEQIMSWKAWFSIHDNKAHFERQLTFLKKPIKNTPVNIKYVLVFGRRCELEGCDTRLAKIRSYEDSDFKIMTFDSLMENMVRKSRLYLGIKRIDHVEIHTIEFIGEGIFKWLNASDIRITQELKSAVLRYYNEKIKNVKLNIMATRNFEKMKQHIEKVGIINAKIECFPDQKTGLAC